MVDACDKDLGEFAREGEKKNVGDPAGSCSPKQTIKQEDQLRDTKAEISEVKEENERLKTVLSQIMKDYNSLHVNFFDIVHQEQAKKPIEASSIQHDAEENELVSLSLGLSSCGHKKEEKTTREWIERKEEDQIKDALSLGLDIKFEEPRSATSDPPLNLSPEISFDEPKEEEAVAVETWPPSKVMKSLRDDEVSQHIHAKRARVSVRARCEAPTMNDGCQWRKYGQKIAKGNPCPRAYYRCTVAAGCPVRKQVQRCSEDMSILITTYEGIHNHPLPISATTMASTTSAAASMLTSGSTSSSTLRDLNFALPNNYSKSNHFYLQNHTLSSSNPLHPTITLDLTTQPPSSSSSSSPNSQLNKFSPNFISNTRFSPSTSRSLCFNSLESNAMPTTWSSGYLSYGAQQSYNNNGKVQIQTTSGTSSSTQHHPLTDTIAKAITTDPSFQTMLAAAITSYVGAGRDGELSAAAGGSGSGCGSSYMTGSDSLSLAGYQGNMALLRQSMGFSGANGAASPVENREHNV